MIFFDLPYKKWGKSMKVPYQELILSLVKSLSLKSQANIAINKCLKQISDCFGFTGGGIYEINQYDCYSLKEFVTKDGFFLKNSFTCEDLTAITDTEMQSAELIYLNNKNENSSEYMQLLKFFSASAIAAKPLFDDANNVCAFVVFFNQASALELNNEELAAFSDAAGLVVMYINKRVYESKLHFAQTTMESILDNTGIDIYVNDFKTHEVLYVNKSMAAPYGGVEKFKSQLCWKALFPEQNGQCSFCPQQYLIDENGEPTKIYKWDYKRSMDGSWFRVFSAAFRWTDGRLAHVVSSADITDNKRNEEIIQYMANYDELTNLPNRRMLVAECEKRIHNAKPNTTGYVLFLDIDDFKSINDNLGHDAGDEFLIQLGEFFQSVPNLKNEVYRNGGDEFVAILDGEIGEHGLDKTMQIIFERFKQPWRLKNGDVISNTSIGVSCFPSDDVTVEGLLNKADKAMYHSKRKGGGFATFARDI